MRERERNEKISVKVQSEYFNCMTRSVKEVPQKERDQKRINFLMTKLPCFVAKWKERVRERERKRERETDKDQQEECHQTEWRQVAKNWKLNLTLTQKLGVLAISSWWSNLQSLA